MIYGLTNVIISRYTENHLSHSSVQVIAIGRMITVENERIPEMVNSITRQPRFYDIIG